jgi:hypothetical protein
MAELQIYEVVLTPAYGGRQPAWPLLRNSGKAWFSLCNNWTEGLIVEQQDERSLLELFCLTTIFDPTSARMT